MHLQQLRRQIRQRGLDAHTADLLLGEVLGLSHLRLHTGDDEVPCAAQHTLAAATTRLLAGEPLQYVLGYWYFCGHRFITDSRALIPRPETEALVALAAQMLPKGARVIDLGCGTGCIGISLALARPDLQVTLLDISAPALALAKENAAALGAQVTLVQGDMRSPLGQCYDALLSNPPYIAPDELELMDQSVRQYEPALALYGGVDGLEFYRALAARAADGLTPGGLLAAECGFAQTQAIARLWQSVLGDITVQKDDAGHPRIVYGRKR